MKIIKLLMSVAFLGRNLFAMEGETLSNPSLPYQINSSNTLNTGNQSVTVNLEDYGFSKRIIL